MTETIATFVDKRGEQREIHRPQGQGLKVKRLESTPALVLNQHIAGFIGAKIREHREAKGWTLAHLCLAAGLSSGNPKVRMWEIENAQRRKGVRLGTLYAISSALGIEARELLPTVQEVFELADVDSFPLQRLTIS